MKSKYEIYSLLSKIYTDDLTAEVIEDMNDPEDIFKSYKLQSYFDCKECTIDNFDYYSVALILKKMEEKHLSNPVDQIQLSKMFY